MARGCYNAGAMAWDERMTDILARRAAGVRDVVIRLRPVRLTRCPFTNSPG
jgi:hypothetical protein